MRNGFCYFWYIDESNNIRYDYRECNISIYNIICSKRNVVIKFPYYSTTSLIMNRLKSNNFL